MSVGPTTAERSRKGKCVRLMIGIKYKLTGFKEKMEVAD